MAYDFSKFDKQVDLEGLKNDLKEVEENGGLGDFPEVPLGTYEVKIKSMELGMSNTDKDGKIKDKEKEQKPMVKIQFEILTGEYKKSLLFYNQVIDNKYGLHNANELLRSLDSGVEVDFESYTQYADMILDIAEAIDGQLEYAIEYGENKGGYPTFKVVEIFEVE